jgi:hypothetical protein
MDSIHASAELSQPLLMVLSPKTLGHGNDCKNRLSRYHWQPRNIPPLYLQIFLQLQIARLHDHILGYRAPNASPSRSRPPDLCVN